MLCLEERLLIDLVADLGPGRPSEEKPGFWPLPMSYRLCVAADDPARRRARRLVDHVYRDCGYLADAGGADAGEAGAAPPFTLLIEDASGEAAATVSLVFDEDGQLPCTEIFAAEIEALRAGDGRWRSSAEVTRLVIAPEHSHARQLLVALFNFAYLFARRARACDEFLVEVNPRHAAFYERKLGFERLGPARPCPRVLGAPAELLRLDLAVADAAVRRVGGRGAEAGERTLYPWFLSPEDEPQALAFLTRHLFSATRFRGRCGPSFCSLSLR